MKSHVLCAVVGVLVLAVASVSGQSGPSPASPYFTISLDRVYGLKGPDTILAGNDVRWILRLRNDSFNFAVSNGFRVYSPDGAVWDSSTGDTLGWRPGDPTPGQAILSKANFDLQYVINRFSNDGLDADTIAFLGAKISSPGLPPGFNDTAWAVTAHKVHTASHNLHLCIDSSFFRPGGTWKWVASGGINRFPEWDGPHCYLIFDTGYVPPANIVLSEDTLVFSAIQGGSNPASQNFDITSSAGPLNFTLTENATWMSKAPIQGTTPRNILVTINITGLTTGVYFDSIQVDAPPALNSPQFVYVKLTVTPPPSLIVVNPTAFFFNALVNGANPAPDTLAISNGAGGTLNWSVTHTESWLSLNPTSGVNSGEVVVTTDITGLPIGIYYDTILVTDPNATNDSVKVPVRLTIASDLPLIAVDSAFNYIIVDLPSTTPPPRDIYVHNAGGGTYDFTIQESSSRIVGAVPSSGTQPQTVQVSFDLTGALAGQNLYDTLWVVSNEASNSPFPVVFQFHVVNNPAIMHFSRDTIHLNVYECSDSTSVPSDFTVLANFGADNPLTVTATYESSLFFLNATQVNAPFTFYATARVTNLPLGTYYDTIMFSALNAINSPQYVIVEYNKIPGDQTPVMSITRTTIITPRQEDSGPFPIATDIQNVYPGCMPWSFVETIPWFEPTATSGNVRGSIGGLVSPGSLTLGTYRDSFYVEAPTASNSPQKMVLELRIWRFHGDMDWDGVLDISDITQYVSYLFSNQSPPRPEYIVGDCNCDGVVDIADLTYMVLYLWEGGPIPCGNPY
ncbi:MAG: hypothetical protein AB1644_10150 [Candidatus Zixiibacteriota bacterium]